VLACLKGQMPDRALPDSTYWRPAVIQRSNGLYGAKHVYFNHSALTIICQSVDTHPGALLTDGRCRDTTNIADNNYSLTASLASKVSETTIGLQEHSSKLVKSVGGLL